MGVSPREFWGKPRVETTTYEYEGDRVVSSTRVVESPFDEYSRSLLLAADIIDADMHSCGQPWSESTSNKAAFGPGREYMYVADEFPKVCYACEARHKAEAAFAKQWPDADMHSRFFGVNKISLASPGKQKS